MTLKKLTIQLNHEEGDSTALPWKTYVPTYGANAVPVLELDLGKGARWEGLVEFYQDLSREDDKLYRKLTSQIKGEMYEKFRVRKANAPREEVRCTEKTFQEAKGFFDEHFKFKTGPYEVLLRAECQPEVVSQVQEYAMTMYETDLSTLAKQVERYRFGEGVFINMPTEYMLEVSIKRA